MAGILRGGAFFLPDAGGRRGYRGFRKSLETHWQAYLDGKLPREAAVRQILVETAPPKTP